MEPERAFPRGRSILLLAVADGDGGIEVQAQFIAEVRSSAGGPRPLPRLSNRGPQRGEVVGVGLVQDPPRGGHRGDPTVEVLTIPEHTDPANRVRAIGDRDRQIREHPPRRMNPRAAVGIGQRCRDSLDQTGVLGHLPKQTDPGVRHHTGTVRGDHDPTRLLATLHLISARSARWF